MLTLGSIDWEGFAWLDKRAEKRSGMPSQFLMLHNLASSFHACKKVFIQLFTYILFLIRFS